jgi:hypothetical protein
LRFRGKVTSQNFLFFAYFLRFVQFYILGIIMTTVNNNFSYTDDDLEHDTKLFFSEDMDFHSYSIVSSTPTATSSSLRSGILPPVFEHQLEEISTQHLANLRYLQAASSIVSAERNDISKSLYQSANKRQRGDSWEIVENPFGSVLPAGEVQEHPDKEVPASVSVISSFPASASSLLIDNPPSSSSTFPIILSLSRIISSFSISSLFPATVHYPSASQSFSSSSFSIPSFSYDSLKLKQLKKDIERDKIILNNERLVGASYGLNGILSKLCFLLENLLLETSLLSSSNASASSSKFSFEMKELISYAILSKASRTYSGSLVLHALQSLIDSRRMLILPQSSITPPIRILLVIDKIPDRYLMSLKKRFTDTMGTEVKIRDDDDSSQEEEKEEATEEELEGRRKRKGTTTHREGVAHPVNQPRRNKQKPERYQQFFSSWGIRAKITSEFIYHIQSREEEEEGEATSADAFSHSPNPDNAPTKMDIDLASDSDSPSLHHQRSKSTSSSFSCSSEPFINKTVSITYEDEVFYGINLNENELNNPLYLLNYQYEAQTGKGTEEVEETGKDDVGRIIIKLLEKPL